jgi:hypothetical protein
VTTLRDHPFWADMSPYEIYQYILKDEVLPMGGCPHIEGVSFEKVRQQIIVKSRNVLIEWMFEVGDKLKQSNLTIHIAIAYLDKIFYDEYMKRTDDLENFLSEISSDSEGIDTTAQKNYRKALED